MEELEYENIKLNKVEEELDIIKKEEEQVLLTLPKKYSHNPILLSNLMSITATKITNIAKIKERPYFARIDFKDDKKQNKEKIYIGKIGVLDLDGNIVITDWRAPISTLYYDSNLGRVEYIAPEGIVKGDMSLKRQIIISNKRVTDIFDVDSVSDDELLKPYLGANADNRLKNIVASIQGEQNYIIRKGIEKNIVVQGVAGSGKTTVALHRIAYLMYNNSDKYKADQFMVIGPNKFFINYISNVLPDLDAGNAVQLTIEELAKKFIDEDILFEDVTKNLSDIIDDGVEKKYLKFKNSMDYYRLLDNYLNDIESGFISAKGLVINNIQVLSKEDIENVYKTVNGSCVSQKLEMTSKVIANRLKNNNDVYEYIKNSMDTLCQNEKDVNRKRNLIKKEFDMLKELTSNGFEKQLKKLLNIDKIKVLNIYIDFINSLDDMIELKSDTMYLLKKKTCQNEDIAALLYIKYYLFGNEKFKKYKQVVVDEAQDFGKFTFYMLKLLISNATFSIFGDIAQGIYSYKSIDDFNEILEDIFKEAEYIKLKKSYRTSIEIMNEANKISKEIGLDEALPVIRSAGPVIKSKINKSDKENYIVNQVKKYKEAGFKSIAIIYKNQKELVNMNKKLKENNIESEIIYKDQEKYEGGICLLTSYLSKGLEFDVVIIADVEDEIYKYDNRLDMKLLYVSMTRALHKLELVYETNICRFLK